MCCKSYVFLSTSFRGAKMKEKSVLRRSKRNRREAQRVIGAALTEMEAAVWADLAEIQALEEHLFGGENGWWDPFFDKESEVGKAEFRRECILAAETLDDDYSYDDQGFLV